MSQRKCDTKLVLFSVNSRVPQKVDAEETTAHRVCHVWQCRHNNAYTILVPGRAIPTPKSGSPCASQHLGRGKPALLVARGCMRSAEGLTHSKASRPLSSSSLLSEVEFETEVEELEELEDNVRECDLSGLFTGDGGVSPLANRWRKSPATSPSQSALPRFAAGILSTTACTASRSRVLRSSWLAILVSVAA